MLPAAKKKNKEHTWETSRTQWVCETIGKLPLREGIPGIKDPHRTGEHTAETGITGTTKQHHSRSLKKEEKCSQQQLRGFSWAVTCPCRRKSSCAPWTDGTWAAAAGLLWGQGSVLALRPAAQQEHSPLLLLGGQLPRQLKTCPETTTEKPQAVGIADQGSSGQFCQKGAGHIPTTPQLGAGKGFASLHNFCVLVLLLGMRVFLCLARILSYQKLCSACCWQ